MADVQLPPNLQRLSSIVDEKPELFASGSKDIRDAALSATQFVFDLALRSEAQSQPHIGALLASFSPSQSPQTRSQTRANGKRKRGSSLQSRIEQKPALQVTPLTSLFVEGMNDEQVWAQLELRTTNICGMLQLALEGTGEDFEGGDTGEMKKRRKVLDDEEESLEEEDEDTEDDEEDLDDASEMYESGEDADLGEEVEILRDTDSEDDEGEDELDLDGRPPALAAPRNLKSPKAKRNGHPELDDGFFDLASFNAETEEAEARSVSRGILGNNSDEEDSESDNDFIDMFGNIDEQEDSLGDLEEASYKDFFRSSPHSNKVKGKCCGFSIVTADQTVGFLDAEEDESDEFEESEGGGEDGNDTGMTNQFVLGRSDTDGDADDGEEDEGMGEEGLNGFNAIERLKDDLFADEEDEQQGDLSTHEKRQSALRDQIAALESENVSKKDWMVMGEATSRTRPQNSLLEEDLEFERAMKAVPVVTEDVVKGLEDRIKARILENQFDDVTRRRPVDDKPFLPSRLFELQDTKSTQSLAQIYEDDYSAAQTGGVAGEDRDGKLKKEHNEIEKVWESISSKLDALSNVHFTPEAPKATISTVPNVASASMESALPTSKSAASMLAPEEVFDASSIEARVRSELTPTEKRALRNKHKKAKKKARDVLEKSIDKFTRTKGRRGIKAQKEAALKSVVKSGKGVTVVGKMKEVKSKKGRHDA
ncbi:hypothetical protein EW146_g4585 [Bondarzewia mesenterica]|uniref:U3 small nucleolar ribonucleoprotein protein MPP10 n=1 Tax=Bondarzewia mesenterica TaxID=1095465 RepID=A0A4S4LW91_9AGAM|nr:hypothetical protein EW146_g4585 [Bondarzewia mesenterica]